MKDFNFRGLILTHLHMLHSNIQKLNSLDAQNCSGDLRLMRGADED